jgi:O-antigen/teichoic acid export membrane protein
VNIPFHLDLSRMFRRYGLYPVRPDWGFGLRSIAHSVAIAVTAILDISRLQGVRIFLGALVGITEMTAFATMRLVSNLSLQGIGTIINPVMPEIMRFLRDRDAERMNATTGYVWLLAVVLLTPALIVIQWIMPAIFHAWTRGKVAFSPAVFGLFSITLLLYSVARPAAAVLQGNNLLKIQLFISIAMCAVAVPGILVLAPAFGMIGAAIAMLLAELVGTVLILGSASRWLNEIGIGFPSRLFVVPLTSIAIATIAIALMVWLPRCTETVVIISLIASCLPCIASARQLRAATRAARSRTGRSPVPG